MSKLELAARAIRDARSTRTTIGSIVQSHDIGDLDSAYEVAAINTRLQLEDRHRSIVGLKVGLTSKAVQQQLGVDQPDFGVLLDDMEYLDGDTVPMSRLIQPKVEAEVAFVIGKTLTGTAPTWSEFLLSIRYALPALEIVDSVITDWKISLVDTVADNASSGLYVLGSQPVELGSLSLGDLGMQMTIDGQVVSTGTGAACLGHPLRAAYWLAKTMAARGQPLVEGQVILSGALGPMAPLRAGSIVQARIGQLGSVACRMA